MAALSTFIEALQTLPRPNSNDPRALVKDLAVEFLYPIIPPNLTTYFTVRIGLSGGRISHEYAQIFYNIRFGYIVPGAFSLTILTDGVEAYNGTLTGYSLETGIDYLYFLTADKTVTFFITNLTGLNQTLEFTSRYLQIDSQDDWRIVKDYMKMINFPYKFPEER